MKVRLFVCALMCFLFGLFVSHFYFMWQDVVVYEPRPNPLFAFSLACALSLPLFLSATNKNITLSNKNLSFSRSFSHYGLPLIIYSSLVLSGLLFIYDILFLSPATIEPALAIWPCIFMGVGASALFVFLLQWTKYDVSFWPCVKGAGLFLGALGIGWGTGYEFWMLMAKAVVYAVNTTAYTEISLYAHAGGLLFITQLSILGYLATFFLWEKM
jgi:hypothetical protein